MENKTLLKITLLLAATLTVMAGATIAPSLPKINEVFSETDNAELLSKLVMTIPALLIAFTAPFIGVLLNRVGRLRLLYFSLALYAIAGSSGLYLNSLTTILIGRALLGVAVGGIMTTISTLIGDYFEGQERDKFSGLQSMFMSIGGIVFVSAGGFLSDMNWRYPFAIYLFSIFVIVMVALSLKEPSKKENDNLRTEEEGILQKSTISIILLTLFLSMVLFYMIPVQIPFVLKKMNLGAGSLSGLAIALATIGSAIGSFLYAKFRSKLSAQNIFALAFIGIAVGYFIIGLSDNFSLLSFGLLIGGFGVGFIMPNGTIWLLGLAPSAKRGIIMGLFTSAIFLGQFMSPLLVDPFAPYTGLQGTFILAGGLSLAMAVGYLIYGRITSN